MKETDFKFSTSVLAWPLYVVVAIWLVFWLEILVSGDFSHYGILPRTLSGLKGILFAPFLHGSIQHLYNNSVPLFVLIGALRFFYREQSLKVLVLGVLFSGLGTWLIGRESFHIGASGLIYVLVSFMFFKGFQSRYFRLVALSLALVLVYGGLIWYVFPTDDRIISWESHLSGFVVGYLISYFTKTNVLLKPIKYDWQDPDFDSAQDDFMQHFDADGNFAPKLKEVEQEEDASDYFMSDIPIFYDVVAKDSK